MRSYLANPNKFSKLTSLVEKLENDFGYYQNRLKNTDRKNLFGTQGTPQLAFIQQGHTGDCSFLSAVCSLAFNNSRTDGKTGSQQLKNLIKDNGNGTYTVTFPGLEDPTTHKTPAKVTVDKPTDAEVALYASAGANGFWLTVLEKAYCKYRDNVFFLFTENIPQDKLKTGENVAKAMRALTNHASTTYTKYALTWLDERKWVANGAENLKTKQTEATIQAALIAAYKAGAIITLTVAKDVNAPNGLLPGGHCYALVGVQNIDGANPTFTIRNPWGDTSQPNGNLIKNVNMDFLFKYFATFIIENN